MHVANARLALTVVNVGIGLVLIAGCGPEGIEGYSTIISNESDSAIRVQFGGPDVYNGAGMAQDAEGVSVVAEAASDTPGPFVGVGELNANWTRTVDLYDMECNRLAQLTVGPGVHRIRWDGMEAAAEALPWNTEVGPVALKGTHCPSP